MSEPPRICLTCRHWDASFSRILDANGDMSEVMACEYGEEPDQDERCIDVWPRPVEEEVPVDADEQIRRQTGVGGC